MDGREVRAALGLEDDDFHDKITEDKASLDEVDGREASAKLGLDDDDFRAKVDEDRADFDRFDGDHADATLGLNDDEFRSKLAEDEAALQSLHGSASLGGSGGGGGEGGGSLLGAITLGAGALMPGIAAAGAGLGLLGGTAGLAFGGVAKALSAHSQATQNVGLTGAQLAATAFSNAVAIQQAQQAESQAYAQAGEAASQSAAQVESAQMSQAEAVRNAAQSQAAAIQAVTQAQQQEQQASFGLGQAQYNLRDAWIQARFALEQLNDAEHNSATTIKAARLAVEQAQYQQRLTDQNAMSTSLDRQQAAIAVTQAQEQLTSAQQQAAETGQEANLQDKAGVAGSQQVLQAKQAVKQAMEAVRNAAVSERDAVRNLTDTELNNADQVKAAQLAVSQAVQQAAYQQQQSALAEQNAAQNVANTYKEQKLQAAATASTSNQAANQFIKDMGRLSPAARTFVRDLLGMRGAIRGLEGDAQSAILPGMTIFLNGVKSVMPEIRAGITGMGRAMSSAFAQFGKVMQTPAFAAGLQGLIRNGIQFANTVLPAFAQFLQQLGLLGSRSGAVTGLSDGLRGLGLGLAGLVRGLTPFIPEFNQIFQVVGKLLQMMGPSLATAIGGVATALSPLMRFLNSSAGKPILRVLADVAAALLTIKGLAKILPGSLGEAVGKIPGLVMKPVEKLGGYLGGLGAKWARSLGGSLLSGLKSMGGSIWGAIEGPLGTAAGTVARWGEQFAGQIGTMAGSAASFAAQIGEQLASAAGATAAWIAEHAVAAASFIAENTAMAVSATAAFIAENAATLGIGAAVAALVAGIVLLATHWHEVWDGIKAVAEDAWQFITTGWGKYLFPEITLLRDTIGFLGDHWSEIWGTIKDVTESVYDNAIKPVFSAIETGAQFLVNDIIVPAFRLWLDQFTLIENAALWLWHNVLDPVWQGIETGARDFVSGFETVWNRLISVFRTPVNFLITTVYDDGIRRLWDDVVNAIGLKSLDLPHISPLAGGGVIPGYKPGHDSVPAMLSPGEGVLTPGAVRAVGPGTVHALNAAYPPASSPTGGGLGQSLARAAVKLPGREIAKHVAERPAEHLLGFAKGGVVGNHGGFWNWQAGQRLPARRRDAHQPRRGHHQPAQPVHQVRRRDRQHGQGHRGYPARAHRRPCQGVRAERVQQWRRDEHRLAGRPRRQRDRPPDRELRRVVHRPRPLRLRRHVADLRRRLLRLLNGRAGEVWVPPSAHLRGAVPVGAARAQARPRRPGVLHRIPDRPPARPRRDRDRIGPDGRRLRHWLRGPAQQHLRQLGHRHGLRRAARRRPDRQDLRFRRLAHARQHAGGQPHRAA